MRALRFICAASLLLLTACSPLITSSGDYTRAAARAAGDAGSEVATAALVCRLAADERATSTYLSVVSGDAEQGLFSISTTFGELQPVTSDDLTTRADVERLLSEAQTEVSSVRIAVTAGEVPPPDSADRLLALQQELDDEAGRLVGSAG